MFFHNNSKEDRNELEKVFREFLNRLDEHGWSGFERHILVDEYAKKIGKFFGVIKKENKNQVRIFYDEILGISVKLEATADDSHEKFNDLKPAIFLLKPKAAYKNARKQRKKPLISDQFKEFIFHCVDSIKDLEDFLIFAEFFEAMYAYYYASVEKNSSGGED
ncbi:MAG: type III-A CRISPR-associated protein Csm2 [Leptospiraceae bacterium]|nr:type III-A CRISPR-associated protein Csm2 [Leptospiraceae bacterium]